jgi:hypothetical protein
MVHPGTRCLARDNAGQCRAWRDRAGLGRVLRGYLVVFHGGGRANWFDHGPTPILDRGFRRDEMDTEGSPLQLHNIPTVGARPLCESLM